MFSAKTAQRSQTNADSALVQTLRFVCGSGPNLSEVFFFLYPLLCNVLFQTSVFFVLHLLDRTGSIKTRRSVAAADTLNAAGTRPEPSEPADCWDSCTNSSCRKKTEPVRTENRTVGRSAGPRGPSRTSDPAAFIDHR